MGKFPRIILHVETELKLTVASYFAKLRYAILRKGARKEGLFYILQHVV